MRQDTALIVAVDGPAASGKTTLARHLASRLGLKFLDTGLLYRAVGRRLLADGGDGDLEGRAVVAARELREADFDAELLAGERIGAEASRVASIPAVREALLTFQRQFPRGSSGAVVAGRDIATVVFPDAPVKLFVTASLASRARRRSGELRRHDDGAIERDVLRDLAERDRRDEHRSIAPLFVARDALVLNSTSLDTTETAIAAERFVRATLARSDLGPFGMAPGG